MADSFNSFNEDIHSMVESIATAMATFRSELEKLQGNMTRRDEERKNLIEELVARVEEVKDLNTGVTILEKALNVEISIKLVDDALVTVEAVLVLFTPRRARLFLTQFETWILVIDTTTGSSASVVAEDRGKSRQPS
uniref:Uncharacterized protein n=1 Tax=Ananas comosus var. bracteatus TaxID=296719 RepID=A0A6V7QLC3_ANACO|nr:unnamed protein product [Ananas comosus var. bracteatus]